MFFDNITKKIANIIFKIVGLGMGSFPPKRRRTGFHPSLKKDSRKKSG